MIGLNYAVSSLMGMAAAAARLNATHCLSIGDAHAARPATPDSVQALQRHADASPSIELHHFLNFNDICRPGVGGGPEERHVRHIMRLAGELHETDRLLVHCHAGVSRSTAAAWISDMEFRRMRGAEPGLDLFASCRETLHERRPFAMPNPVMMQIYLDILNGMDLARDVAPHDLTAMRFSGGDGLEFSIRSAGSLALRLKDALANAGAAFAAALPMWKFDRQ